MAKPVIVWKSGKQLSARSVLSWRIAQTAVWLVGAFIMFCLFFFPSLRIVTVLEYPDSLLLRHCWLFSPVCGEMFVHLQPLFYYHAILIFPGAKKLSATQLGQLNFAAVVLLFIIVPLRHAIFNNNGPATGLLYSFACGNGYRAWPLFTNGKVPVFRVMSCSPCGKLYGENVL